MNSVGVLPLSYLDNSDEYKSNAIFNNARALLNQFLIKSRTEILPLIHYFDVHSNQNICLVKA